VAGGWQLAAACMQAMKDTSRCNSMAENLNSNSRNYFTLRRQFGGVDLDQKQSLLNYRTFLCSSVVERLGYGQLQLQRTRHGAG
jgi:hypothetical protein